jgi:hypothetical protein
LRRTGVRDLPEQLGEVRRIPTRAQGVVEGTPRALSWAVVLRDADVRCGRPLQDSGPVGTRLDQGDVDADVADFIAKSFGVATKAALEAA